MLRWITEARLKRFLTPNLIASTIVSLLSAIAFVTYLIIRTEHLSADKQVLTPIFQAGLILGVIAQILQTTALGVLIFQWFAFADKNTRQTREVILLFFSLIPYVPLLLMLIVVALYIWRKTHHPGDVIDQMTNAGQSIVSGIANDQNTLQAKVHNYQQLSSMGPSQGAADAAKGAISGTIVGTVVGQVIGPMTAGVIATISSNAIVAIVTTTLTATAITGGAVSTGVASAIFVAPPVTSSNSANTPLTPATQTAAVLPSTPIATVTTSPSPTESPSPIPTATPITTSTLVPIPSPTRHIIPTNTSIPSYTLKSSPTAISWGGNHIDLFARATTGDIIQRTMDANGWGGWHSIGGQGLGSSRPAASSWGVGELDVVIVVGNHLYLDHYQNSWTGWNLLPVTGAYASDPASVSIGLGRIDYAVRLSSNEIIHGSYENGTWQQDAAPLTGVVANPVTQPGMIVGSPTIEYYAFSGNLAIFSNCQAGLCYNFSQNNDNQHWDGWNVYSLNTYIADPASTATDATHFYFTDVDAAHVYETCWLHAGNWACNYMPVPAGYTLSPTLSSSSSGQMDLFAVGSDYRTIYTNHFDGAWHGWSTLP